SLPAAIPIYMRQTAPREPGFRPGQTGLRYVERIEAACRPHQRAQQQGLPPGAGAEVDDHLAASRRHERHQDLTALVLHFDFAFFELWPASHRRTALKADAPG